MANGYLPATDAGLLAWSLNFSTLISATPTAFGLTSTLASQYATYHSAYATAFAAVDPAIRTRSAVVAKNQAKINLKNQIRLFSNLVNGAASVTDAQKTQLGLPVRHVPTPIPAPASAPGLDVRSVSAWTAQIKLHDSTSSAQRGKPPGVSGASVFSYAGTTPPADISAWKFEGNTGRTKVDVVFDNTLPAGAKVWLTAFWFNGRKQSGPACSPVGANLPGGSVTLAA